MENPQVLPGRTYTQEMIAAENARFMTAVYGWMAAGLCTTGLVAWYIGHEFALTVVRNRPLFWTLIIAQLGAVVVLSGFVNRLSAATAGLIYFGYAALTGVTLSVIFLIYTASSIGQVFFLTAISFAGLSFFGLTTRRDLGPIGAFCMMGLFGLVGFALLSFFFPALMSDRASFIFGIVGVIVFAGLTAYNTQQIKAMNTIGTEGTDANRKKAIVGALTLYLNFINLFLSLLRLMGRRR